MNHFEYIANTMKSVLGSENVLENELMKNYTSFKVGGPVDILTTPENYEQVVYIIKECRKNNIPYFILGNGSNLLVRDGGLRGVVIKLTKLNKINTDAERITAQSGTCLVNICMEALRNNLTGLEFACGIPGSIGGAITMNAGAYNGEISQVIESALVIDNDNNIIKLDKEGLELGYRMSAIIKYHYIVLEATFKLQSGIYDKIKTRMDDLTRRRKERQPLEFASAGSTFKRPDGYFAAKLIEDSGLKGIHVGDAEVSMKHSGFIVNKGNATASDILELIDQVTEKVKENFQVELSTEVRIVGENK